MKAKILPLRKVNEIETVLDCAAFMARIIFVNFSRFIITKNKVIR